MVTFSSLTPVFKFFLSSFFFSCFLPKNFLCTLVTLLLVITVTMFTTSGLFTAQAM